MTPQENDEKAILRGGEARVIVESRMYQEAHDMIERNLVNELAKADTTKERAEYLRQLIMAGRAHRRYLQQVMEEGRFVAESVKQEEARRRWFRAA